jgi:hypothetical protein
MEVSDKYGAGPIRAIYCVFMEIAELARVLVALGCPAEKSTEMAMQLDKRAKQLMELKGRSYEEAMAHLLALMRQGWAAKQKLG